MLDYQFRLASRIRKARELANYTQEYMASQIGISQQQYSQLEKGETRINQERLQKIANALDTTPEKIADFDERQFFGNKDCTFNDNYNIQKVETTHLEDIKQLYESRIADLQKEIERLHALLEKALLK